MKALRIIQVVLLVLVAIYLVLIHDLNRELIRLPFPFVLSLPPAALIALSLVLGWLVGWSPGRIRLWRREREVARLERRVRELEEHLPSYDGGGVPVIPDRDPARAGGGARGVAARLLRRGERERPTDETEPQA